MSLRNDINKIPELKNIGLAMIDYVESLCLGIEFKHKSKRWVGSLNFVAFKIQHACSKNIIVSLRGSQNEFLDFKELPLRNGMGYGSYTECTIDNPRQFPAIMMHIKKSFELFNKGRNRVKTHPKIIDKI